MEDARLTDIEIQLMHHEKVIQELSEVIAGQQRQIEGLTVEVDLLRSQMRGVMPSITRETEDEVPPPHY